MQISNEALPLITIGMTIFAAIYRLAQVESDINARITRVETNALNKIDELGDSTTKEIHLLQIDLLTLSADYKVRKEWQTETAHGLKQMIAHKFSRLNFHVIDLQRHLEKNTGFIIHSQPVPSPEDEGK